MLRYNIPQKKEDKKKVPAKQNKKKTAK